MEHIRNMIIVLALGLAVSSYAQPQRAVSDTISLGYGIDIPSTGVNNVNVFIYRDQSAKKRTIIGSGKFDRHLVSRLSINRNNLLADHSVTAGRKSKSLIDLVENCRG